MDHVRDDLSAYLDGALAPERQAALRGHLDICGPCRAALAELRATASLIAILPSARPSRRLVPALAARASWLRPLRSLSTVAAGAFLLVFMASATLDTGFRMGGGRAGTTTSGAAPAAAPAGAPGASLVPDALQRSVGVTGATGATGAQDAALSERNTALQASGAPPKAAEGTGGDAFGAAAGPETALAAPEAPRLGPSPWLWLALMLVSALSAVFAHRRLRA